MATTTFCSLLFYYRVEHLCKCYFKRISTIKNNYIAKVLYMKMGYLNLKDIRML